MTEFFPGMDVRKMDLNRWNTDGRNGVTQGDTGMGVISCVDDDDVELALGFLNPADQFAFDIGLPETDFNFQFRCPGADLSFDVLQSCPAINFRLARTQQV